MTDFKKLLLKLCIIAFPAILAVCLELFLLPPHFFTFRVWEALTVGERIAGLDYMYYPLQKVEMVEQGDLAHGTSKAINKSVLWMTDAWGMRNRPNQDYGSLQLMIVGDSNLVGSSVSQGDMLSEVMTKSYGIPAYTYAPASLQDHFTDPRWAALRPAYVVYSIIERSIPALKPIAGEISSARKIETSIIPASLLVLRDRLKHSRMVNYLAARLQDGRWIAEPPDPTFEISGRMLFLQGEAARISYGRSDIDRLCDAIVSYQAAAAKRGQKLVFLPIPNKETIYFEQLPTGQPSNFLATLISALKERDVMVVDTVTAFMEHKRTNPQGLLYHQDDSHWQPAGIRLAAQSLAGVMGESR